MKSKILFMILLILSLSFSFSSHSWGASKRSKVDGSTKIIEANDIEKQFAKLQNVMSERQHLEKRLSKVGEWLPLWLQMKKDINVEKLLKELHKRLAEIKQQEQKLRESLPVWNPPGNPPLLENMSAVHPGSPYRTPFPWRQDRPIPPLPGPQMVVQGVIEHPTDFYVYKWSDPAAGWGNENDFKWDLLRRANQQERTSNLLWIGGAAAAEADAVAFDAWLIGTLNGSIAKYSDSMAAILCFKYTFPEPQTESVILWSTQLKASLSGVGIWGDGSVNLQPVVSITDEISISSFWWQEALGINERFSNPQSWYWKLSGIIDAPAGKTPVLTLGISIKLTAEDPSFESNVGYIGDSRGETYTGHTPDIDMNALWNEGLFSVRWDTGIAGSEFTRYRPGVQYQMVPWREVYW